MPYLRDTACRLAKSAIGIPYIWGGNRPAEGLDCSGFVIWVLQVTGALGPDDFTAQSLFRTFIADSPGFPINPLHGNLAFYGERSGQIEHVMLTLGGGEVIGACGGSRKCLTREFALNIGAKVQKKYLQYRSDLVAVFPVHYPDEE